MRESSNNPIPISPSGQKTCGEWWRWLNGEMLLCNHPSHVNQNYGSNKGDKACKDFEPRESPLVDK